jgi:hypothetical protein
LTVNVRPFIPIISTSSLTSSKGKEHKTDPKSVSQQDNSEVITDEDVKELARRLRNEPEGDVSQLIGSFLANIRH